MSALALTFAPDGSPRVRQFIRETWTPPGSPAQQVDFAQTPWFAVLRLLLKLRYEGPTARLLCEQVPPKPWAALLRVLGLSEATTVFAQRWPLRHERTPLPKAAWLFPTRPLAAAWQDAGVDARCCASIGLPIATGSLTEPPRRPHASQVPDLILWSGPLVDRGSAKSMLWTFDVLAYLEPELHLLIAGVGPDEQRLRAFARGLAPCRRIHFAPDLAEEYWRRRRLAWINDPTAATPDFWLEAHARGVPCLVAQAHASTALLPLEHAPLVGHAPPAWASATANLLQRAQAAAA